MAKYVTADTIARAVSQLKGTAGPFLQIWMTLKHMGLSQDHQVMIDTSNSTPDLDRLYGTGGEQYFIPFAHTERYAYNKLSAARSIVQTNIRQWEENTGTKNFGHFLDVKSDATGRLIVGVQRSYPRGLGTDANGFAQKDGLRVAIPIIPWSVWYGRQSEIPEDANAAIFLRNLMTSELGITPAEEANIFVNGTFDVETQDEPVTDAKMTEIAANAWTSAVISQQVPDSISLNEERVRTNMTSNDMPVWMNRDPEELLREVLDSGHKAIVLTGPPRTGKTRAVKNVSGADPIVIQIHDGWNYSNLIMGQTIKGGDVTWEQGPLTKAVLGNHEFIVLEEINRTRISQALGEVFSLLEGVYRGEENAITLPSGEKLFIGPEQTIIFTMNTLDASTEDVDDALFGRLRAIEFPPRVEKLDEILAQKGIPAETATKLKKFFVRVQDYYPLGHGYFASLMETDDIKTFYATAIRPVLANHFAAVNSALLNEVDTAFDEIVVNG